MGQCTSEKGRDAEAWPPGLCVRPVVGEQDTHRKALKTVQGEISQKANRGEEERSGQIQRSTRTVWWSKKGGNEWVTEIGRDK